MIAHGVVVSKILQRWLQIRIHIKFKQFTKYEFP